MQAAAAKRRYHGYDIRSPSAKLPDSHAGVFTPCTSLRHWTRKVARSKGESCDQSVIPAEAGLHSVQWIPAFAGLTVAGSAVRAVEMTGSHHSLQPRAGSANAFTAAPRYSLLTPLA